MAADLDFTTALHFARALKTIKGFPWDEDTINATAADLVKWCKGGFISGRPWTPEEQAGAIVDEARESWEEWLGSSQLKRLFLEKFAPAPELKPPASSAELVQRGLLAPPCIHCEPGAEFCEFGGARQHQRAAAEIAARPPAPVPNRRAAAPVDLDAIVRDGERLYREEQERKARQLQEHGL